MMAFLETLVFAGVRLFQLPDGSDLIGGTRGWKRTWELSGLSHQQKKNFLQRLNKNLHIWFVLQSWREHQWKVLIAVEINLIFDLQVRGSVLSCSFPPLPTPARLWTFSLPVTPPYVSLPKVVCGNVRSEGSKRVLTNWIKTGWMMYTPHTLLNQDKRPTPVTTPPPTGKAYNTQQKLRACGNRPLHASTQSNMHLYDLKAQ